MVMRLSPRSHLQPALCHQPGAGTSSRRTALPTATLPAHRAPARPSWPLPLATPSPGPLSRDCLLGWPGAPLRLSKLPLPGPGCPGLYPQEPCKGTKTPWLAQVPQDPKARRSPSQTLGPAPGSASLSHTPKAPPPLGTYFPWASQHQRHPALLAPPSQPRTPKGHLSPSPPPPNKTQRVPMTSSPLGSPWCCPPPP